MNTAVIPDIVEKAISLNPSIRRKLGGMRLAVKLSPYEPVDDVREFRIFCEDYGVVDMRSELFIWDEIRQRTYTGKCPSCNTIYYLIKTIERPQNP